MKYIDAGHAMQDASAQQNHTKFARRGCGKTLLLQTSRLDLAADVKAIYLTAKTSNDNATTAAAPRARARHLRADRIAWARFALPTLRVAASHEPVPVFQRPIGQGKTIIMLEFVLGALEFAVELSALTWRQFQVAAAAGAVLILAVLVSPDDVVTGFLAIAAVTAGIVALVKWFFYSIN
jgi:hypothetical protein